MSFLRCGLDNTEFLWKSEMTAGRVVVIERVMDSRLRENDGTSGYDVGGSCDDANSSYY